MPVRGARECWMVAAGAAVLSGVLSWVTTAVVTSARDCATGSNGAVGTIAFLVCVLLSPSLVLAGTRRWEIPRHAVPISIAAAALAIVTAYLGGEVWWSAHHCASR